MRHYCCCHYKKMVNSVLIFEILICNLVFVSEIATISAVHNDF